MRVGAAPHLGELSSALAASPVGIHLAGGAAASVLRSHWFCEKLPRRAVIARKYSGGFSLGVTDGGGKR